MGMGMGGCGHPGILSVAGHGESRVAPDQVMISLGVTTQAPTAAQAMSDNSTRQQAVLDALKGAGVEGGGTHRNRLLAGNRRQPKPARLHQALTPGGSRSRPRSGSPA